MSLSFENTQKTIPTNVSRTFDEFEFSEILGYTKNHEPVHDTIIIILKNDDVENYFLFCKSIKQQPYSLYLNKTSLFDIAMMYQAHNIADFIFISAMLSNDSKWSTKIASLLWTYNTEAITPFLLRYLDYPNLTIFRTRMIIEESITLIYKYTLELEPERIKDTIDFFQYILGFFNARIIVEQDRIIIV